MVVEVKVGYFRSVTRAHHQVLLSPMLAAEKAPPSDAVPPRAYDGLSPGQQLTTLSILNVMDLLLACQTWTRTAM